MSSKMRNDETDLVTVVDVTEEKLIFKPSRELLFAFSALMFLALATAFDATSLSVALPTISSALGGTALEAFWSGTNFLLASTVLQPSISGLSHIFGRKYVRRPHSRARQHARN